MRLSGRKPSSLRRPWIQRQRVVLLTLISLNVAVYVMQLVLDGYTPGLVRDYLGLSERGLQKAYAWQFLTAPFLHSGPWHLLGNMIVLYLLGRDVESILGQRHFFFLYVAGAAAGELGHLFLMPSSAILLAGSGGAVAVLMAYATILPELEIASGPSVARLLRLKAKHLAYGMVLLGLALLIVDRTGTLVHSALLGGCAAGWLYAHLLGFGRPSYLQRTLHQRKVEADRYHHMDAEQFIAEEVDPLLEKISREGLASLTRRERRTLARGRDKLAGKA
ncbi:MAG: rhomboid family intramembrane serine protease [Chthoniobacterales bacterium]|nr:rhomboid family intramembrane serine protease [Chthoniobacterales bacterium]